jgi:hydroxymethylbilane synthase
MSLRLLSRASDLATLQARLVAAALRSRRPDLDIVLATQSSEGDRDRRVALWEAADKGLFTTDLSQALVDGRADLLVHSWKDLPIASHPGTRVAATLERADPHDVLLVRRDVVTARPASLKILTSSPRRAWQIERALRPLLPWPAATIETSAVRGNIPTRLAKLVRGDGDALVVAKAALDRLLSPAGTPDVARSIRASLDACRWMVLPLEAFPTAPAQGALAVEIADRDGEIARLVATIDHEPTRRAVVAEREILAAAGGGCHEAIGATVRVRDYGVVTSVRGKMPSGEERQVWSLDAPGDVWPRAALEHVWPRRDERERAVRAKLPDVAIPPNASAFWIARADALPESLTPAADHVVWTSGARTWAKLARRGIWVNGSADGLGDGEQPNVDTLVGRALGWLRLTHADAGDPDALATYAVTHDLPADLSSRTHFFWTSGRLFRAALERFPALRDARHASGPGRTAAVIHETLGPAAYRRVWLDYDQWLQTVLS